MTLTLAEAILATLENPAFNRHYIYAARPFTPDSPAFVERQANLGWDNPAYKGMLPLGVVNMAYVKDMRDHYLRFSHVTETQDQAVERLVEFYQNGKKT